jgi:hypothetical protein
MDRRAHISVRIIHVNPRIIDEREELPRRPSQSMHLACIHAGFHSRYFLSLNGQWHEINMADYFHKLEDISAKLDK